MTDQHPSQDIKRGRSIRWKLAAAFLGVACFVAAFVAIAIAIHVEMIERAARLEAAHVAELMADTVVDEHGFKPRLQEYVSHLKSVGKRDFVIVDAKQMGLADAHPEEVGQEYVTDPLDEVGSTIKDGKIRTFVEHGGTARGETRQLVVPIRQGTSNIGAVVLEYSPIREELFAADREFLYLIAASGVVVVLLVTLFGFRIATRIAQPLVDLKESAVRIATQDYAARVVVTSHDEIGQLGSAFNKMAEDLGASHAELVESNQQLDRSHAGLVEFNQQLDQKVSERTQELREAAIASLNMMQDVAQSRERVQLAYDELSREMAQRKKLELESRDLGAMVNNAHDAIFVCDIDHRIRSWNRGAARMYGWSADEAIGQSAGELLYDDPGAYLGITAKLLVTEDWTGQLTQKRKDGSAITVEAHKTLIRDDEGRPKSILAINTDITDRLELEQKIQQSQRLDAIGQLTGGVAHDFNNLLTVIYGNSELLVEQLESQPRLRELASMTLAAAQRGGDLTHRLLAFARRQPLDSAVVDVNGLLANMAALLSRTLSAAIRIEIIHGPGLWPVVVDASQLESAILNLAINARDAMAQGGRLVIESSNAMVDEACASQLSGLAVGRYVLVSVTDTGKGIRQEDLKRVFEPFFTTKEFGKGTGLGLSMIYGFVMQSRGHVSIYSEPGKGTTVKMYLPTATGAAELIEDISVPDAVLGGTDKILMVEDDDAVRRIGEEQLRKLGYDVVSVADGAAALDQLRGTSDFALLFTDMVMPGGMSGAELARAAIALQPTLKVLYTSGYVEETADNNGSMPSGSNFLGKPYSRAELARKIRSALSTTNHKNGGG